MPLSAQPSFPGALGTAGTVINWIPAVLRGYTRAGEEGSGLHATGLTGSDTGVTEWRATSHVEKRWSRGGWATEAS